MCDRSYRIVARFSFCARCLRWTRAFPNIPACRLFPARDIKPTTLLRVIRKGAGGDPRSPEDLEHAIRQIVSRAVASDGIIDIFADAGLKKPDISILSDQDLGKAAQESRRRNASEAP